MYNEQFLIGKVYEVEGVKLKIKIFKEMNGPYIFDNGVIVKSITVGGYVEIPKGYSKVLAKITGEYVYENKNNEQFLNNIDYIDRYVTASILGVISESFFISGLIELPLIFSDVYIATPSNVQLTLNNGYSNLIPIAPLLDDSSYIVSVDYSKLFASHIGIFGNTGSGKSSSLCSIYRKLFLKCNFDKKNSRFVLIDFNNEYKKTFETYNSKYYELDTSKNLDVINVKIKMPRSFFVDNEIWSIIGGATEKTQKPFLDRTIRKFKHDYYSLEKTGFLPKIKEEISNLLMFLYNNYQLYINTLNDFEDLFKLVCEDVQFYLNFRDKMSYYADKDNKDNSCFRFVGESVYMRNEESFKKNFVDRIVNGLNFSNEKVQNIFTIFSFCLKSNYLYESFKQYINTEFVGYLIPRIISKINALNKLIEISDEEGFWDGITIVGLNKVNLEMKKIIPLIISKYCYNVQKQTYEGDRTLHLIVDEAHNILSEVSERENSSMKEYRLEVFEEIIKEGRKFGTFLTISSQRPSDISETIISQMHNYFIHRLINHEDLLMIQKTVSFIDEVSYKMLPILPPGACIFSGTSTNYPQLIKMEKIDGDDAPKSETIDLSEIWQS